MNLHVETTLHDVLTLPNFLTQTVLNPDGAYHGVAMVVIDSIQGPGLSANDFERWQALFQATALTRGGAGHHASGLSCHQERRDRGAEGVTARGRCDRADLQSVQPTTDRGIEESFRS